MSLSWVHNLLARCLAWGSFVGMGPPPLMAFDLTTALWCVILAYQHYLKHVKHELFCLANPGCRGMFASTVPACHTVLPGKSCPCPGGPAEPGGLCDSHCIAAVPQVPLCQRHICLH